MKTWHYVNKEETVIIINHKQSNLEYCILDFSNVKVKLTWLVYYFGFMITNVFNKNFLLKIILLKTVLHYGNV